jgi:hypothetical protein
MKVERIYANELDTIPEMMARKQRKFERRLASHDEMIALLLSQLETMQSSLPRMEDRLKAIIDGRTASQHGPRESLRTRMEPRLWAIFRQRLQKRLGKHLGPGSPG